MAGLHLSDRTLAGLQGQHKARVFLCRKRATKIFKNSSCDLSFQVVWILPVELCASGVFAVGAQLHSIWSFSFGLQFGPLRIGIFIVCSGFYSFKAALSFVHEFNCEVILCRVALIWALVSLCGVASAESHRLPLSTSRLHGSTDLSVWTLVSLVFARAVLCGD